MDINNKKIIMKKSILRKMIREEIQKLTEATITLDTLNPSDKQFIKYLKKNNIKIIKNKGQTSFGGDEITYKGTRESLRNLTIDQWDEEYLAKFIKGK